MTHHILNALIARAKRHGMGLTFTNRGTHWEARWTTGTRAVAWAGTLADVWAVSEGRLP